MSDLQFQRHAIGTDRAVPLGRLLALEITIGTLVNIAFNLFFAWLVFYGRTPIGRDEILLDTVPAAFLPAFLMTFPVTYLMRKRIGDGLTVVPAARAPFTLPQRLPWRALAVASLALALTAVPTIAVLWLCWGGDWTWGTMLAFKIAFSAGHALIISPIVVLAALTLDRSPETRMV